MESRLLPLCAGWEMGKICVYGEKAGGGGEAIPTALLIVLIAKNSLGDEK